MEAADLQPVLLCGLPASKTLVLMLLPGESYYTGRLGGRKVSAFTYCMVVEEATLAAGYYSMLYNPNESFAPRS